MAILRTEAVILKGWKLGETSKILALFTQDYGKVKVVAKGGRGPKSKFKGCLETLTHIRAVYYDKPTRDLQLLSQADLVDPHIHIIGDMTRTTLGLAAAELLDRAVAGQEAFPQIFNLLAGTLDALNRADGFLEGVFWYFETRFIDLMGYKPTWEHCLRCDCSLGVDGGFFQPNSGGLLCKRCGGSGGGLTVDGETLEILFWLEQADPIETARLEPTAAQKAEIRKMFDLYFRTHIDHMRSLRSLKFYYEMEST